MKLRNGGRKIVIRRSRGERRGIWRAGRKGVYISDVGEVKGLFEGKLLWMEVDGV